MNRRPKLTIVAPTASEEEAAAVVAALERFMRETAPQPVATRRPPGGRHTRAGPRAALGVTDVFLLDPGA